MIRTLATVAVLALLTATAHGATVTSRDWQTAGDGLLTYDSATNLEWLDNSVTANVSFDDVQAQIAPGGALEGFRVASLDDVWTLFTDYGLAVGPVGGETFFTGDDALAVQAFLDLTWEGNIGIGYSMIDAMIFRFQLSTLVNFNDDQTDTFINACCGWETFESAPVLSTWLVREASPVPVPAALVLLASGLVTLPWLRRPRRADG